MAQPFGGHPRLGEYMRWAAEQGCSCQTGVDPDENKPFVLINNPNGGGRAVIAGMDQSDYLSPAEVSRLDRRLGLQSPFAKLPEASSGAP